MALLTTTTLIRLLSLLHLTTSYYLLTSPSTLSTHPIVLVLGAAMDLPAPPPSLNTPSAANTLAALFLALLGISDLVSAGLDEEIGSAYWCSQVPVRVGAFFAIGGWAFWKGRELGGVRGLEGEGVGNGGVFAWGFGEMVAWFWIYTKLREERRNFLAKKEMRKKAEEDRF